MIEHAETHLRSLGLSDCRVRLHEGGLARIETPLADVARLAIPGVREELSRKFHDLGFRFVTLDLDGFRSGSLNELVSLQMRQRHAPDTIERRTTS
jgi:pyridinium-3,5-biscarboxylic acid mononucleotide sulfurtransferase